MQGAIFGGEKGERMEIYTGIASHSAMHLAAQAGVSPPVI